VIISEHHITKNHIQAGHISYVILFCNENYEIYFAIFYGRVGNEIILLTIRILLGGL